MNGFFLGIPWGAYVRGRVYGQLLSGVLLTVILVGLVAFGDERPDPFAAVESIAPLP